MVLATKSYLETVRANGGAARDLASLDRSYASTIDSAMNAWTISQAELNRLLRGRLSNLLAKLRGSLIINGLLASLSLVLAVLTYRGIVHPLQQLEGLAKQVGETGDYSLRSNYKSRDEMGRLTVALNTMRSERHEPGGVLLTVEDSGTGIELENIDQIFKTFFTTKAAGMGMGLSICRSIVEAHGGRISASRANPHGSVFQVFLPIGERSDLS
jgi:nitrogen fixation/metabolism regulation signal transduction histidine kinase